MFIIGNWKMNPLSLFEAKDSVKEAARAARRARGVKVVIAPPSVFLPALAAKKSGLFFAAQDVSSLISGSHTGEVGAKMFRSAGASFAIVGHSERRAAGDSDEIVAEKFIRALEAKLVPVLCVGEKKRDQEGNYFGEIARELSIVLKAATKICVPKFIVAYEPVWAVGGSYDKALSPEEMSAMAIFIKKTCAQFLPKEKAMRIPVLYGGSVDAANAKTMLSNGGINGLLIGRQSLDPRRFAEIIKLANA